MYTFIQFLEAVIGRNTIPMDQDDVAYLSQFPKNFWIDAIKQRYNDLLLQAIQGKLSDPITVTVTTKRGPHHGSKNYFLRGFGRQVQVNAHMNKLIEKLKNLGYDLSDPHPETGTLSNMKLMTRDQARQLMRNWVNHSQQQGMEGLAPGFARFTPTKLERGIQSYDNPQDDEARNRWIKLEPIAEKEVKYYVNLIINRLANPDNTLHLNYYYWIERLDELIKGALKRIQDNLANPEINDKTVRNRIINSYVNSMIQKGHANRRMLEKAKEHGMNIPKLIKQGYTMFQIADAIKNNTFQITDRPQQQNDLKSIHQSVETPASTMANYGNKTIGGLRQAHSQKVMADPALQQNVTPYKLAPEVPLQPQRQRKAAKDISDMGFKDWVSARR